MILSHIVIYFMKIGNSCPKKSSLLGIVLLLDSNRDVSIFFVTLNVESLGAKMYVGVGVAILNFALHVYSI